ncbi:unnamed protein product [Brachionus calyciflorus]|uniref:ZMYM2-like/QRICH1 C-terminal domain-containing protein n=1 Tax=Brachionus calyciflorus TaxID=104777 RepID=A0A814E9W9_9BILA|nr:unnamed protein product [Brachionus calyciflorus]
MDDLNFSTSSSNEPIQQELTSKTDDVCQEPMLIETNEADVKLEQELQQQTDQLNDPNNVVLLVTNELVNAAELNTLMQNSQDDQDNLDSEIIDQNPGSLSLNDANLDQCDDSNLQDDIDGDISFKQDMDDVLSMSPSGGLSSGSFILNGSNVSTHTFRKTEWDVKKLENYVRQSYGDMTPMENMEPEQMNTYLKSFFELAKKSDGMEYEPESLIGFMNSFERYLKTKNYPESLLRSETFKEARTILKKKRDLVRSIGKLIRTKTKDTCYLLQFHRNLLKEKGLLNRDNPDCLLAEIYLNNMIYFGEFLKEDKAWRGNLNLVWGDMILERDPHNGLEYLTLATYAKKTTRNPPSLPGQPRTTHRTKTGTQTSKLRAAAAAAASSTTGIELNCPRVYTRQPPLYCPIEAYKIYRSRRPNNCLDRDSPFYLAPLFKSKNNSKTWYKALAMSCQRLDALFYCLFKKAGVDLTSLASMSQSQQQQAVAAAASIMGSEGNVVSPVGWKPGMKEPNHITDVNELVTNGYMSSSALASNGLGNTTPNNSTPTSNTPTPTTTTTTTSNFYQSQPAQQQQQQHIITTVPAQVQVQVQIQVQIIPQQQQQLTTNQNSALTLLA